MLKKIPIFGWFLLIGMVVFSPILFNGFLGDDFGQIVNNPFIYSLKYLPQYFSGSTFYAGHNSGLFGTYYKPLLSTSYALIYTIFKATPFGYHLIQLLLHIGNTYLLYKIFSKHFHPRASFLAALVFLIHPINTETVVYIADLQDVLFMFFGLWALRSVISSKFSWWTILRIFLLLLFSLLSKETGILFLAISLIYVVLFKIQNIFPTLLTATASLSIYAVFRFIVAGIGIDHAQFTPISYTPFTQRLLNIPQIIVFYLKNTFYPQTLYMFNHQLITTPNLSGFYLPLLIIVAGLGLTFWFGRKVYNHHRNLFKIYLLFCFWFGIGLGFHLQLFPLDATTADRWFYFPLVGLLGIGLVIAETYQKTMKSQRVVLTGIFIILAILLSGRTFVRATDFKDGYTLSSRDIKYNPHSPELANILATELSLRGEYQLAIELYTRSVTVFPYNASVWFNLATVYQKTQDYPNAESAYKKSIEVGNYYRSFENLADLYLRQKKYSQSVAVCDQGLRLYPANTRLWLLLAISYYQNQDQNFAEKAILKLVSIDSSAYNQGIAAYIFEKKPINIEPLK